MSARLATRLLVDPEIFGRLFGLPHDAEIVAVRTNDERGVLEILIHGAGWPTAPGALIQTISGDIHVHIDPSTAAACYSVTWPFPVFPVAGAAP